MAGLSYNQLMNEGFRRYKSGRYVEAYELVTELAPSIRGTPSQTYNFRFCVASVAGWRDLALQIMREAIIEKGFWYSKEFLGDSDLDAIRETKEFKELAEVCSQREEMAKRVWESKIFRSSSVGKSPVLIALHGNGQNLSVCEDNWASCRKRGYSLALLQSSQISYTDGYYWTVYEKGSNELQAFWRKLEGMRELNLQNSIVAGFSAGARVALYSVLTQRIKPKAFILVGPWIPEIEQWAELMDGIDKRMKGFIICGDKDEDCYPIAKKISSTLNERKIVTEFQTIPGLDHDFPEDFAERLDGILDSD